MPEIIISKMNSKYDNLIFNAIYRPSTGHIIIFEQFCKEIYP